MSTGETNPLIVEAYNDGIIRYNNQTLNYECVLCKKSMTGDAPLAQHLESKKHEETAFRYAVSHVRSCPESLKKFFTPEIKRAVEEGTLEVSQSPGGVYGICCKVCNKDLTGYAPVTQHLMGADHRKQLQGVQPRIPSFVTGANNNDRLEEARSVTSPLVAPGSESFVKFPPRLTPTCTSTISSTQTTPIPTLTFRNDQRHVPNGTSLLEPSYPRLPEPVGLYRSQPSHRETSPIRFPTPLSPIHPMSLSTSAVNSFPKRSESREAASSSPLTRHTLPLINPGANHLDPNSIVLQAVNDNVLVFNYETLMYTCKVCGMSFNTQQTEDHLKHKIHREASAILVVSKLGRGPPSLLELLPQIIIEAAAASTITIKEGSPFRCVVCDTFSTGVIPLKQHLESRDHLKRNGVSSGQPTFPHLISAYSRSTESSSLREPPANSHAGDDVDVDALTVAFERGLVFCVDNSSEYECRVCSVTLNGLKNLQQHMKGAKHKKQFQKNSPNPSPSGQSRQPSQSSEDPNTSQGSTGQVQPYDVNTEPRGLVYVFNYKFTGRKADPKERKGAEQDTINLMKTFMDMGYEVILLESKSAQQTRDSMEEIRQSRKLERVAALILFFLSHGNDPYKFYAEDGEMLDLQQDVWSKLTNTSCPSMKNKPKIIFANFCRGSDREMNEYDAVKDVPRDLVTIHATTEGITARRNHFHGTHFVQSLCEALRRYAQVYDLRKIYEELDPISKGRGGTQPKWEDSRFNTFYFNPINPILS